MGGQALGEAFPALVGLYVVQADDGAEIGVEQGLARQQAAFQTGGGGGGDGDRLEIEVVAQLRGPLFH